MSFSHMNKKTKKIKNKLKKKNKKYLARCNHPADCARLPFIARQASRIGWDEFRLWALAQWLTPGAWGGCRPANATHKGLEMRGVPQLDYERHCVQQIQIARRRKNCMIRKEKTKKIRKTTGSRTMNRIAQCTTRIRHAKTR